MKEFLLLMLIFGFLSIMVAGMQAQTLDFLKENEANNISKEEKKKKQAEFFCIQSICYFIAFAIIVGFSYGLVALLNYLVKVLF